MHLFTKCKFAYFNATEVVRHFLCTNYIFEININSAFQCNKAAEFAKTEIQKFVENHFWKNSSRE